MQKAILIIGQGPSKSGIGKRSLDGEKGSGARLAELAGVSAERLHEVADVVNLLDDWHGKSGKGDKFPLKLAREKAETMLGRWQKYERIVLLGNNVALSFGLVRDPLVWNEMRGKQFAVVPHPSGVNRWYNDEKNKTYAAAFLQSLFSDCKVPVEGTVISKSDRAAEYTRRLEEYDQKSDWVDLAILLVEVERERLFLEVGCKTWDEWLRKHAPRSYRLCYMVKAQYKALEGSFTLDELRRIPPETARWAAKSKNLSPAALSRPEVKAALMQPRRKAVAELQESAPDEHVEDTHNLLCKFAASQYNAISEPYEAYKLLVDDKASIEDFLEHVAEEWFGSLANESFTFRQLYHDMMKGIAHDQGQEKAASAVAAV